MKVKEINIIPLIEYLKSNGYDGLYNDEGFCACELNDLAPCEDLSFMECKPGYKVPCIKSECENGGECKFHIGPEKVVK
jgi:hypothetical protein